MGSEMCIRDSICLVEGPYDDLRKLLSPTQEELDRFRQLLIIADEDLNTWGL